MLLPKYWPHIQTNKMGMRCGVTWCSMGKRIISDVRMHVVRDAKDLDGEKL